MKALTLIYLSSIPALLSGCVGYNSTLFMTKSNVGLDLDTKPPTLEISLARREGVISPAFEGGQTPPVLASFVVEPGAHVPLFPRISQTFSGGNASVAMATLYASEESPDYDPDNYESALPLTQTPQPKVLGLFHASMPKPGTVHPFLFGTDTTFGLKAAWSGLTAQFPDTVRLGLNRKEFALAPIFLTASSNVTGSTRAVKMPSFLATMDNSSEVSTVQQTGVRHVQYFATGLAAEQMAMHPEVRQAMLQRLDPNGQNKAEEFKQAQARVTREYQQVAQILKYVSTPDGKVDKDKLKSLTLNTGLADKWVEKYSNGTLADLEGALKGKYRSSVGKLGENIK